MSTIKAHFDGTAFIPDEAVNGLRPGDRVEVVVVEGDDSSGNEDSLWTWLDENPIPAEADLPQDLSHQHDHYLYGTKRKPE